MPITTPIIGQSSLLVNQQTTLTNATSGGVWSSSNSGIAAINAASGVVTAVTVGTVVITYTIGGSSVIFSLSTQPYQITNGFNTQLVLSVLNKEVIWQSQGDSNSGRHFEDFHALCDENIIKSLFPTINPDKPTYNNELSSLNNSVVLDAVNDIYTQFQLVDKSKLIFDRSDYRLYLQPVPNANAFCGITFSVANGDFAVAFKNLVLFFDKAITFNLYLYNDMLNDPIAQFPVTVNAYSQTTIPVTGQMMLLLNYLTPLTIKGGRWFLGYYQDDIVALGAHALFYNIEYTRFKAIQPFAFSAPIRNSPVAPFGKNFDRFNIGANNLMYGMNAEVVSYIDPTNNIIENPSLWDNLIGLLMAKKIIEAIVFSYRNNKAQVNLQGNDILDKLYIELNSVETASASELNYSSGLRKQISDARRVVKEGFQKRSKLTAGCG